jgi:hypothetical protein
LRHLPRHSRALTAWLAVRISCLLAEARAAHTHANRDRGANVVETIVIVAGFGVIAAGIYVAVKTKVDTWIAKIP